MMEQTFFYLTRIIDQDKTKAKIIYRYGTKQKALSHKTRLEKNCSNLAVFVLNKQKYKNQIIDISELKPI